jgi:antitoxin component of MazEF toxin-antitoxin module
MFRFRAPIEVGSDAPNSWAFVRIPSEILRELGGSRRVTGTVAAAPFEGSLQARGQGEWAVLVKRELRAALGLRPGDEVEVALEADTRPPVVAIPAELATALAARPDIAHVFETLAPSHRREYADWIAQAKKPATKSVRVERALAMIAEKQHRV